MTAASAPVERPAEVFTRSAASGSDAQWQAEAWEHYRTVPELHYVIDWVADSCSRVRLVPSAVDPDSGFPTGAVDEDDRDGLRFAELVRAIAGGPLGQAELIARAAGCLQVAGEVWVAMLVRPEGDRWLAVTRREMERDPRNPDGLVIKLPDGSKHKFDPAAGDGIFRVWNPDREDASAPDSPVRACLAALREIQRTTRRIANADASRLVNNGLLVIPQEASLPSASAAADAGGPGGPGGGSVPQQVTSDQRLQRLIVDAAMIAYKDENSMAGLIPIVVGAPGEFISQIKHIDFGKDVTDTAIKTRTDAITRLAMGLNVSRERLLGLSEGNHWSAWAIEDQDVQLHIAPVMETICQAIYAHALTPMLEAEGIDPSRYVLWYDTSRLTADPDLTDEAKDAFDRGQISGEALVRLLGLPQDARPDLTTPDGLQAWARDKVCQDPSLIRVLAPVIGGAAAEVDWPVPVGELPSLPSAEAGEAPVGGERSGAQERREPRTEKAEPRGLAASAGPHTRSVLELAAVDLLVGRALELAGKRRVRTNDRAQRDRLRGVPPHEYHRVLGPVADSEVESLIDGFDAQLGEFAAAWGLDEGRLREAVVRRAHQELTREIVEGQVV